MPSFTRESGGTLHVVVVGVNRIGQEYSTSSFSIVYDDSTMLRYNGTTIHRNYNRWVRKLERRINDRFVAF